MEKIILTELNLSGLMQKEVSKKFHGIPKSTFNLHLKECEFRFNHRDLNIYILLLEEFRKTPINYDLPVVAVNQNLYV